jgi:hypothetical protein
VFINKARHNLPVSGYGVDSRLIIIAHEAAVALDIGTQNGGELTFNALCGHDDLLCL